MAQPQKVFREKPGDSFGRFEKAVKQILSVPKKEIDRREAEYEQERKKVKRKQARSQSD